MLALDEIRILDLPPKSGEADDGTPIECTTRAIKLTDDHEYEALSYVWGTDPTTALVRISGQDVQVSKTLEKALRRLQLPDRTRALWIDQLCIDQNNSTEKMQQVRHMGSIYEECTQCIAWMGEVRDDIPLADADAAVQLLHYMVALDEADDLDSLPLSESLESSIPGAYRALKSLSRIENPWWTRMWTVQEAVLPDNLTFQWGPFTFPWDILMDVCQTLCGGGSGFALVYDDDPTYSGDVWDRLIADTCWVNNAKIREDEEFHMSTPFQLIQRWRWREATNPLDKIYGVLGLFDKGSLPVTERCDYDLQPSQVYATMTQELILNEKGLRPLTVSPRVEAARATPGILSWALDLNAPDGPAKRPAAFALIYGYWSYQADQGLEPMDLDVIRAQLGQNKLTLTGLYIDTIEAVGERQENGQDNPLPIAETLRSWHQFAGLDRQQQDMTAALNHLKISDDVPEKSNYPGGRYGRNEAFARLALGDVVRDGQQVPMRTADEGDVQSVGRLLLDGVVEEGEQEDVPGAIWDTVRDVLLNQRVFSTAKGLLGCGHLDTQPGDQVWVFRGGRVPFVVRPRDDDANGEKKESDYTFVGECYVQGIMQGEGARGELCGGRKPIEQVIDMY
ncbi:heterokaryon incompatibility protein-domain-containing protein [Apiospora arundinis]